ncbi:membrane protein insertase YidC isoform X2 [Hyalella azteca]|uniref:Membrane protein insertase YidC isoform X2 n=1 Tax=Hyalella azteca TaxID=294128 RepID=A0A979FUU5_HYAAZ|nr:membrane protein insertase YidC isoform X2 [Hyalella azteca]
MNSQNFLLMPLRLAINNVKCAGKYPTSNEIRQISLSAHMNQWSVINSKRLHKDVKIDHKYSSTTKNCLQNSNFLGNCHNLLSCNTRLLTQCRHNSSYIPDFLKGWSVSAASSVSSNAPTNIPEPPPSLGLEKYILQTHDATRETLHSSYSTTLNSSIHEKLSSETHNLPSSEVDSNLNSTLTKLSKLSTEIKGPEASPATTEHIKLLSTSTSPDGSQPAGVSSFMFDSSQAHSNITVSLDSSKPYVESITSSTSDVVNSSVKSNLSSKSPLSSEAVESNLIPDIKSSLVNSYSGNSISVPLSGTDSNVPFSSESTHSYVSDQSEFVKQPSSFPDISSTEIYLPSKNKCSTEANTSFDNNPSPTHPNSQPETFSSDQVSPSLTNISPSSAVDLPSNFSSPLPSTSDASSHITTSSNDEIATPELGNYFSSSPNSSNAQSETLITPSVADNLNEKLGAGPVAGTGAGPVDGIEYIPVPPPPLDAVIEPAVLNSLGEATLTSLGLGGWGPVGLMQQFIELIHVHCGLPWWGAIAAVTVAFRLLMSPLVLMAQRNAAQLHNVSPQMQVLQMKITEARESGDQLQVSRYTNELMVFMKEKNVNPLKSMIVPIAQAPIFISMFVGLRRCAALPVASFTTGGLWWFSDLTVADPYYILPILTSITMYATINIGTEVGRVQASGDSSRIMFAVLEFMPLAMLPFMIKFPAAVLCYWMSSNLVSLGQAGLLRVPAVRNFCKIPQMNKYNSNSLPMTEKQKKKTVVEAVKDSWKNLKVTREVQDRLRYDEIRFEKAGTGPVVRTFKYDPTKTSKKSGPVKAPIKVKASIKH